MRFAAITISKGFKFSKNYNTATADVSLTCQIEEEENLDEVVGYVSDTVAELATDEINKQIAEMDKISKEKRF